MDDPHMVLGTPRRHPAEIEQCSHCGDPIPDHHPALVLKADGGALIWWYCAACEQILLQRMAL